MALRLYVRTYQLSTLGVLVALSNTDSIKGRLYLIAIALIITTPNNQTYEKNNPSIIAYDDRSGTNQHRDHPYWCNDITLAGPPVAQDFSPGEIVDFADTAGVRNVRLELDSNFDGSDYAGLSEVRFTAADSVPEPSSSALLGHGGWVLILRLRK